MPEPLTRLVDDLRAVLQDPAADPQKTALFIAFGTVMLLILVAAIMAVFAPGGRLPKAERPREPRVVRGYLVVGLVLLAAGLYLAADEVTTASSFCMRCHEMDPWVASWSTSTHHGTDCIGCHDQPGVTGHLATRLVALGTAVQHARDSGRPTVGGSAVGDAGCLDCHDDQLHGVSATAAMRVRHSDFLQTGIRCTACHGEAGHGPGPGRAVPTMDVCVPCHDGTRAPDACGTCHLADVAAVREIPSDYPKTTLERPVTCAGCHTQDECRACHPIDMPHPPDFGDPAQHAPLAAFEKKDEVCLRCHGMADCAGCHTGVDPATGTWSAHAPGWKSNHRSASPDGASCRSCHNGVENMCDLCHPPG